MKIKTTEEIGHHFESIQIGDIDEDKEQKWIAANEVLSALWKLFIINRETDYKDIMFFNIEEMIKEVEDG